MHFEFPESATPLHDYSDLLLSWVQTMNDLNRAEAENISHAQQKYLRPHSRDIFSWFHYQELQSIHRAMFGKVWAWAGKTRKSITSIGVSPGLISMQIADLCKEVASWRNEPIELTFLEKSARIHHRLVFIHPFENGNGRFARLVADRCLLSWKCPHPVWPDSLHLEGTDRRLYIQALKAADQGDYDILIALMKKFGAKNPSISTLFQEKFYRSYLEGEQGLAKVRALLRNGADPNRATTKGRYCLQLIIRAKLESCSKLAFVKLLVQQGVEINQVDKSGLTPFQTAVGIGDQELALFLLSKGAHPSLGRKKHTIYSHSIGTGEVDDS